MHSSCSSRVPGILLLAIACAVGAVACSSARSTTSRSGPGRDSATDLEQQYEQVIRTVLPSVVQISTPDSTGSGVVYDSDGDIVTNEHVIGDAKTVTVQESVGNHTLTAKVIGKFAPDDLAVIRVTSDAGNLKPPGSRTPPIPRSARSCWPWATRSGLTDSVTQGIISATGRTVGASEGNAGQALITAAIQTSAAINPGNSGGALVNLDDQVVGIPTLAARLPDQGGAAPGIGFAIPSDTVQNIADQLIKSGKVTTSDRASLGITAQTAANESRPAGRRSGRRSVASGGSAARAGVRPGDIIVAVDGQRTRPAWSSSRLMLSDATSRAPRSPSAIPVVSAALPYSVTATLGQPWQLAACTRPAAACTTPVAPRLGRVTMHIGTPGRRSRPGPPGPAGRAGRGRAGRAAEARSPRRQSASRRSTRSWPIPPRSASEYERGADRVRELRRRRRPPRRPDQAGRVHGAGYHQGGRQRAGQAASWTCARPRSRAMDQAVELTGMEYGGITPIGLPADWPVLRGRGRGRDRAGRDRQRRAALEAHAAGRRARQPAGRRRAGRPWPLASPREPRPYRGDFASYAHANPPRSCGAGGRRSAGAGCRRRRQAQGSQDTLCTSAA